VQCRSADTFVVWEVCVLLDLSLSHSLSPEICLEIQALNNFDGRYNSIGEDGVDTNLLLLLVIYLLFQRI